jgi:tetratricopeptide (TPR) repeat protein
MSRRALNAFWIVLVTCAVAAAEPDAAAKKHAAELAAESQTHYKRGEFEISAALLRQAYALYPEPNLQYNLGRSLESMGDTKGAIEAYENYLANGKNIEDRGAIERRVATLKQQLADKQPKPVETKPVDTKPVETKPVETKPDTTVTATEKPIVVEHDTEGASKLPWVPIAIGIGVLGGGAYVGHLASQKHDDAVAAMTGQQAQALQDDAHSYATYANIAFVVGGVALAAGVVWEIKAQSSAHHGSSSARARIGPTSVALEWSLP